MAITILLNEVLPDAFFLFLVKMQVKKKKVHSFPIRLLSLVSLILKPFHTNNNKTAEIIINYF